MSGEDHKGALDATFPFDGSTCAGAFTLEELQVLDELMVAYAIMDFDPAGPDEIFIWANAACQQMRNKTLEEMRRDKKSESSPAMLKFYEHVHNKVQVQRSEMRMIKTIFPKDVPVQLYMCLRPIRLVENGRTRIVALQTGIPIPKDDECREASVSIEMLTNYTENVQIIFDAETGEASTGNVQARCEYRTSDQMRIGERHLTLRDVLSSCAWASKEQEAEARKNVEQLTLQSVPYEMIARKRAGEPEMRDGKGSRECASGRWHKLVWSPAKHTVTAKLCIMLSEYDISELKQAHDDLEQLNQQQGLTSASVSHEFRAPLNGVLGLTDTLLGAPRCPMHFRKSLAVVMSQARRLNLLVDDILDAASSKRGRLTVKQSRVNLREVVQEVCLMMMPLLKKSITLNNNLQGMAGLPVIEGDADRIAHIFINLIGNSIKFTESGTISVSAELDAERNVVVHVQDSSAGLPEEQLELIWGALEQAHASARRQGSSVGLSMVQTLVEGHRGTIRVTSQCGGPNSGTKVSFSLPIGRATEESSAGAPGFWGGAEVSASARAAPHRTPTDASFSVSERRALSAIQDAELSPGGGETRANSGNAAGNSGNGDSGGGHSFRSLQHKKRMWPNRTDSEGTDPRRRASMDGIAGVGVGGTGLVVGTGQYQICPRCNTEPPSQASFCYKCGSTLPPPCEQRVGSARSSFSGISQYETRSQFNSIEKGGSVSERVGSGASRQTITCSSWKTPVAGGQPREKRTPKRALIIVDLQNDFAAWGDSGNGTMSAPGRMEAVHNTNQLREAFEFDVVVLTRDWHPPDHCSFWSNHEGAEVLELKTLKYADGTELDQVLWPVHCVQGEWGSQFCDELVVLESDIIINKGMNVDVDSYSGFFDNGRRAQTTLQRQLKEMGVSEVYCVGIALDYCVGSTAVDAAQCGFTSYIVEDCSKLIAEESWKVMQGRLAENGVQVINSSQVPMEPKETSELEEAMRTEIAGLLQRVRELEQDVSEREEREREREEREREREAREREREQAEWERERSEKATAEGRQREEEERGGSPLGASPLMGATASPLPDAHRSYAQQVQATVLDRMLEHETMARQAAEKREQATRVFRQREQECWNSLLSSLVGEGGEHLPGGLGRGQMGRGLGNDLTPVC